MKTFISFTVLMSFSLSYAFGQPYQDGKEYQANTNTYILDKLKLPAYSQPLISLFLFVTDQRPNS